MPEINIKPDDIRMECAECNNDPEMKKIKEEVIKKYLEGEYTGFMPEHLGDNLIIKCIVHCKHPCPHSSNNLQIYFPFKAA